MVGSSYYHASYHSFVDCEHSGKMISRYHQNYNDIWYQYLIDNKASCMNPTYKHTLEGDNGTNNFKVMVIDINRCEDKPD